MSDRVAYPVGNTNGRDHIYWPTITLEALALLGYTRTTGVDLATIMALVWRVKKWVVSGSVSATGQFTNVFNGSVETVTGSFDIPSFDMPLTYSGLSPVTPVTRERDIVSSYGMSENGFRGLRNGGFIANVDQNVALHEVYDNNSVPPLHFDQTTQRQLLVNALLFANSIDYELVGFNAGLFYPKLDIGVLVQGQYCDVTTGVESAGSNGILTVVPGVVPSCTFPLRSRLPLIFGISGTVISTTTYGTAALTMTAIEFWPYKNSENLPIYNETTGAQLRDPFS